MMWILWTILGLGAAFVTLAIGIIWWAMTANTLCHRYFDIGNPGTTAEDIKAKYRAVPWWIKLLFRKEWSNARAWLRRNDQ